METLVGAHTMQVPFIILHGVEDKLCLVEGSRFFFFFKFKFDSISSFSSAFVSTKTENHHISIIFFFQFSS